MTSNDIMTKILSASDGNGEMFQKCTGARSPPSIAVELE